MNPLAPGSVLGGYRLVSEVARGGMGVVWLAEQTGLDRRVALKVIAPELAADPAFRARFTRESRMAAHIEHPNVVPIYEASEADGRLFLAMRYVEGTDLRELLRREGRLPPERAVGALERIADALDAAHERGLVHRDVKPANVLIGKRGHVYLTDFGLTKQVGASAAITRVGEWVGTVDYIAPEQIEGGAVDGRADIYSLGCVLHELVTGRPAYERDSDVAKMWAHVHDPPPSLAGEDSADVRRLDPVLARAMATRPGDRFGSAGELAEAARGALSGAPSTVLDTVWPPPPPAAPPTAPAAPAPREGPPSAPTAPLPQSNPWQADSVPPARTSRSSGTAVAIVIVAALVALGGIVAAVFATGALESDDPPATGGDRSGSGGDSPSSGMKAYETDTYTAEVPRGWDFTEDYVLKGSTSGRERRTTELRRGSAEIILDTTLDSPGGPGDAKKTARDSHAGRAGDPGYDLIELEPVTLGDHEAYNWIYAADGKYTTVVYFFDGQHGYGIVGTATPGKFDHVRELTERVAASVASR